MDVSDHEIDVDNVFCWKPGDTSGAYMVDGRSGRAEGRLDARFRFEEALRPERIGLHDGHLVFLVTMGYSFDEFSIDWLGADDILHGKWHACVIRYSLTGAV